MENELPNCREQDKNLFALEWCVIPVIEQGPYTREHIYSKADELAIGRLPADNKTPR